jgi:hypothetical protein
MGDDYPAVLRQIDTNGHTTIRDRYGSGSVRTQIDGRSIALVGSYTGRAVPFSAVRTMFKASGIDLLLVSDIEAP